MCAGVSKSGSPISRCTTLRPWASRARALRRTSRAVSVPSLAIRSESRIPRLPWPYSIAGGGPCRFGSRGRPCGGSAPGSSDSRGDLEFPRGGLQGNGLWEPPRGLVRPGEACVSPRPVAPASRRDEVPLARGKTKRRAGGAPPQGDLPYRAPPQLSREAGLERRREVGRENEQGPEPVPHGLPVLGIDGLEERRNLHSGDDADVFRAIERKRRGHVGDPTGVPELVEQEEKAACSRRAASQAVQEEAPEKRHGRTQALILVTEHVATLLDEVVEADRRLPLGDPAHPLAHERVEHLAEAREEVAALARIGKHGAGSPGKTLADRIGRLVLEEPAEVLERPEGRGSQEALEEEAGAPHDPVVFVAAVRDQERREDL